MSKIVLVALLVAASIAPAFAQRGRSSPPSWYSSSGAMVDRQAVPSSM
jgi:hypothetical protein